jgi:hypothetical protein
VVTFHTLESSDAISGTDEGKHHAVPTSGTTGPLDGNKRGFRLHMRLGHTMHPLIRRECKLSVTEGCRWRGGDRRSMEPAKLLRCSILLTFEKSMILGPQIGPPSYRPNSPGTTGDGAPGPSWGSAEGRPCDVSAGSRSHPVGTRCPLLLTCQLANWWLEVRPVERWRPSDDGGPPHSAPRPAGRRVRGTPDRTHSGYLPRENPRLQLQRRQRGCLALRLRT